MKKSKSIRFTTADLVDEYEGQLQVALPLFKDYGGKKNFAGSIATVKAYQDNTLVRAALSESGAGRVLVVDGGASLRCAMLGDMLAKLAKENDWQGVIMYGCIRDASVIGNIDIGVKALNTNPRKSEKKGSGKRDIQVMFAGVRFNVGAYLYADQDGIVVAPKRLY